MKRIAVSTKCNENRSLGPGEVWGVREGFLEDFLLSCRKKIIYENKFEKTEGKTFKQKE